MGISQGQSHVNFCYEAGWIGFLSGVARRYVDRPCFGEIFVEARNVIFRVRGNSNELFDETFGKIT